MSRSEFAHFVGIDLGGARGKSTALATISNNNDDAEVENIWLRADGNKPWTDDRLLGFLSDFVPTKTVIAVGAPLTAPPCVRCLEDACPGVALCKVPTVRWLEEEGIQLHKQAALADRNRIASPTNMAKGDTNDITSPLPPYTHRRTEVLRHFQDGILPRDQMGQSKWAIASRALHLRRRLVSLGFVLDESLLEVSPRATIHALFDSHTAKTYKRDADPWSTRAKVLIGLSDLRFSSSSTLSREASLRDANGFDALMCAYTAYLWASSDWTGPPRQFAEDGWIWAPPAAG